MEAQSRIDVQPKQLRCPRCLSLDVVHSLRRGWIDEIMYRLHLVPRHCRYCGKRFFIRKKKAAAAV